VDGDLLLSDPRARRRPCHPRDGPAAGSAPAAPSTGTAGPRGEGRDPPPSGRPGRAQPDRRRAARRQVRREGRDPPRSGRPGRAQPDRRRAAAGSATRGSGAAPFRTPRQGTPDRRRASAAAGDQPRAARREGRDPPRSGRPGRAQPDRWRASAAAGDQPRAARRMGRDPPRSGRPGRAQPDRRRTAPRQVTSRGQRDEWVGIRPVPDAQAGRNPTVGEQARRRSGLASGGPARRQVTSRGERDTRVGIRPVPGAQAGRNPTVGEQARRAERRGERRTSAAAGDQPRAARHEGPDPPRSGSPGRAQPDRRRASTAGGAAWRAAEPRGGPAARQRGRSATDRGSGLSPGRRARSRWPAG